MDEVQWNGGGDEMEARRSIRDTGRAPKRYGSTARHVTRETMFKHLVSKTDTLQGIALRYGVTTEQIRRVNKLWASDSLFLREHLLIPVNIDNRLSSTSTVISISENLSSNNNVSSPSAVSSHVDDENSSINDFLAKMDFSIASVKKEMKKVQGSSEFFRESDDTYIQRRRATARLRNSHPVISNSHLTSVENQRPSSSGDIKNLPSAVVMTQGRRVKTSLQRLQKEQDEIFQL
ncbi:PREDICTED: lysM and putative peptidoglycan-binding domain-containing protein 2 [Ceratosolen solmsi marchali]|uniref:LysM and putative peptidoglycan-binding domain-containing protein 2 n=1 Tax=Ceratosolen solmsi marchali TaxID=326594 RepID=A0AAJ6YTL6_9HYME|nr:PREDICTED: lysM and putative peptidoglycan-binding domain-containing protein 2 [Ceratosolen solmsi marchali]